MTKQFERVERGYLSELLPRFAGKPVKGEVTIVIAGSNPKFAREEPDVLEMDTDDANATLKPM
jgi:16S rRNA C1402 (ribose-2'-O) methylase RsmI